MHWKWVSSTSLLCYGQMALHARGQILPWVDNIISRMVYYYSCSSHVSLPRARVRAVCPSGWAPGCGRLPCAPACSPDRPSLADRTRP